MSEDDQKPIEEAASESGEVTAGEEAVFTPMRFSKEIFDIGTRVEDVTTGLVGRIIRRGTNHLICVTEDDIMFKSWIKDVSESVVNGTTTSGVPADQRLVGTDAHFRYVQSLVPGSSWGLQFINKYKVRKS